MPTAVTTPTGNVGRHVVAGLVRAGIRPRVLVRDPDRLAPGLTGWVEPLQVDLGDVDGVVEATRGVDSLYWVTPPTDGPDPLADYAHFADVAADAVSENGISRVVLQSSVGAERRSGAGEIDGLGLTEEMLDRTGADIVHLRCGYFFSNLLTQSDAIAAGAVHVVLPVDHAMPWVAPRDIAEVAVSRLLGQHWTGRVVQAVHGPEDLGWRQVAQVLERVLGTAVHVEQIPDDAMRGALTGFGLSHARVEAILGMSTGRAGARPVSAVRPLTHTAQPLGSGVAAGALSHSRTRAAQALEGTVGGTSAVRPDAGGNRLVTRVPSGMTTGVEDVLLHRVSPAGERSVDPGRRVPR